MKLFKNIKSYFPKDSKETKLAVNKCYNKFGPTFISLKTDKKIVKKNFRMSLKKLNLITKNHKSTQREIISIE